MGAYGMTNSLEAHRPPSSTVQNAPKCGWGVLHFLLISDSTENPKLATVVATT
jgi:hypothetical protein